MPSIYLILILASLSRFSETVYLPSLSFIAQDFTVDLGLVEFTSSLFFVGVAIGNIIWGIVSDFFGKQRSIYIGMSIYILGCAGCGMAENITILSIAKFIQGIGTSAGIIIAQVLTREIEDQSNRAKVFAILFSLVAFVPTIGPIIGNIVNHYLNWRFNFLIMIGLSLMVIVLNSFQKKFKYIRTNSIEALSCTFKRIISDKQVWLIAVIVGGCNGIVFSYFSEGTFYVTNILGLDSSRHSFSHVFIGLGAFLGGRITNQLTKTTVPYKIIGTGVKISSGAIVLLVLFALLNTKGIIDKILLANLTIFCMSIFVFGTGLILPNCLTIALNKYSDNIGSATSFFGWMYYTVMSVVNFFMALLHSDNVLLMPQYFLLVILIIATAFSRLQKS